MTDLIRAGKGSSGRLPCLWAWVLLFGSVPTHALGEPDLKALVEAARERTRSSVTYDGRYMQLSYPGGDVPAQIGVCTDLIIRSFRVALNMDLQREVHEDMARDFDAYPADWGLERPDPNIDHRRVPNLEAYFARHAKELPISRQAEDYLPGDLVTWRLDHRLPHIGIVSNRRSADQSRPLIIHNVGEGPKEEDVLFAYPIHRHFRLSPKH